MLFSIQCLAQVSVQHNQPIKHILSDSFSNILFVDNSNNLFILKGNKISAYRTNFNRVVFKQSLKRNNHFIIDGKLKTLIEGGIVDFNTKSNCIYKNGNNTIEKTNEKITAKYDNQICTSSFSDKIVDAFYHRGKPYVLSKNSLFSVCDSKLFTLPFFATAMVELNEESILISSLENGLWLFRENRIKKYFTLGVNFPQQIKLIKKYDNFIWILAQDKTLFIYNLEQQILKRVAVGVEDFVLDYWHKLWFATNQSVTSNINFINEKDPVFKIESVQLNGEEISLNSVAKVSTKDEVKINYQIEYSPKSNLHLYYKFSNEPQWQTAEKSPLILNNINPSTRFIELKTSSDGEYFTKPIKISFDTSVPFWGSIISYVFIGLLSLIVLMILSHLRVSQKNKLLKSEQKALKLELEVTKKEQKLGQLQLNPHFIFNTMNSINGLIALDKKSLARKALSKFAAIMRTVLSFSFDDRISLESELKFLNDYIKLEQLIRENLFEYSLTSNLEGTKKIPPMIIQPFVENAIIHGLQHKGEKGQLDISIAENGRYYKVVVADNGVGRKEAQKFRKETHTSSAIKIVRDRIAKLDKWKLEEAITYVDLYVDNIATGTKCILQIPK